MADEIKTPGAEEEYQPDLMTLEDEDGNEVTFEVIGALDHKGVPYLAVVDAGISFALHVNNHSFSHASRNVYLNHFLAFYNASAATSLTLVLYYHAFAFAGRAYGLGLHHAEETLCGTCYHSASMTGWAGFLTAAGFCAASMAV